MPLSKYVDADGNVALHHYTSNKGDSFVVDPANFAKNHYTQSEKKASPYPRSFFYVDPADREHYFSDETPHYIAHHRASKIYDVHEDKDGIMQEVGLPFNPSKMLRLVKEAGYDGVFYEGSFPTVSLVNPVTVHRLKTSEPTKLARPTLGDSKPAHDPHAVLKSYVEKYGARLGLPTYDPNPSTLSATPELGIRAGLAFHNMPHAPTDPEVVRAYDALKKELLLQHSHIVASGAKIEPWTGNGQPYANSKEMKADVRNNGHLWYFPTTEGFGEDARFNDHPLFEDVPGHSGVKYNDLLRGVHDYFAHAIHGHQFGPNGEIRAWHEHAKTLSPLARKALTTETHGQNSWVNFGPHKPWEKPITERPYADQKAGLLPENVWPDVPETLGARPAKLARNKLPGGKGDGRRASSFPREQIRAGLAVEREHTSDPMTALEIVVDHLAEDREYYTKLKRAKLARKKKTAPAYPTTVKVGDRTYSDIQMLDPEHKGLVPGFPVWRSAGGLSDKRYELLHLRPLWVASGHSPGAWEWGRDGRVNSRHADASVVSERHAAAWRDHFGVDPEEQDIAGKTALHHIARHEGRKLTDTELEMMGLKDRPTADDVGLPSEATPEMFQFARTKVPANGMIVGGGPDTGGTFQKGGQFAAKARMRIRQAVKAYLTRRMKLGRWKRKAKPATGDLHVNELQFDAPHAQSPDAPKTPLALDEAIHRAKDKGASEAAGGHPDIAAGPEKLRAPLTIRELKDVESSLSLPPGLHLSTKHGNADKTDGDHVSKLTLDQYYDWANGVSRHLQKTGQTASAADRLRDPRHLSRSKLSFIVDRLAREVAGAKTAFADSGGAAKWYGDHVAAMARNLHDSFHNGTPADDEVWGKLDKKTGRVTGGSAATIAKLLVAATSGGMKPHANYKTAHAMIEAGRKYGGGSPNPFKTIPDKQHDSFSDWVNRMAAWHSENGTGVTKTDILHPGVNLKDRVLWYERVMRPHTMGYARLPVSLATGGATDSAARYSGMIVKHVSDLASPDHGSPIWIDKGKGGKKTPYPTTAAAPKWGTLDPSIHSLPAPAGTSDFSADLDRAHKSGSKRVSKIPAVDDKGRLQAPGWTSRNDQVMDGVNKINAVVNYFTSRADGDERKGMADAKEFFLSAQPHTEFEKVVAHTAGLDRAPGAPSITALNVRSTAADYRDWIEKAVAWNKAHKTGVTPKDVAVAARLHAATRENRGFYYPGEDLPGTFLLGPKFGAFGLNLHLDQPNSEHLGQHLTADLWWSRDWNTMLGTLFGEKNKQPKRQETPRESTDPAAHPERKLMRKAAKEAADRAGLHNVAELQAVLWYYEQLKPSWFGVDTSSTSYLDGANLVAARRGREYSLDHQGNIHVGPVRSKQPSANVGEDDESYGGETDS